MQFCTPLETIFFPARTADSWSVTLILVNISDSLSLGVNIQIFFRIFSLNSKAGAGLTINLIFLRLQKLIIFLTVSNGISNCIKTNFAFSISERKGSIFLKLRVPFEPEATAIEFSPFFETNM